MNLFCHMFKPHDRSIEMRVAPIITLSAKERKTLEKLAHSNTTSVRLAHRAKIVLLAAASLDNHAIAAQLNTG